jgi:hypothetical protein
VAHYRCGQQITHIFDKQTGVNMKNIQAFPGKQKALMIKSEHLDIANQYEIEQNGMTLRDYFAAKAMALIAYWKLGEDSLSISFDEIAKDSYDIADEMLKYREESSKV